MGAPKGNQNASKAWQSAIKRAIARRSNGDLESGIDTLAERLLIAAYEGEQWAMLEVGNRLDGKPAQSVTVGGDAENPLAIMQWPLPKSSLDQP